MSEPQPSKANRLAAMWLVFAIVSAACDTAIAAILIIALQTPLLLAFISAAPIACFFGAMFALVKPLREASIDMITHLPSWLFLLR